MFLRSLPVLAVLSLGLSPALAQEAAPETIIVTGDQAHLIEL
jgi:hypothetical protein